MRTKRSAAALLLLLSGCTHRQIQVGRPDALQPILGGRGVAAHVPRTAASEPVENLIIPIAPLRPAWPEVAEQLPGLIRTLVARGSWTDEHHQAVEEDGLVLVRHRPAVLAQVRVLVDGLKLRLLRPLQLEVVFAEVSTEAAARLLAPTLPARAPGILSLAEVESMVSEGQARIYAQAQLVGYGGHWMRSERLDSQSIVAGYNDVAGTITPRQVTLPFGHTVQAAVWRWGEERAVVAMTALYTGAAASNGLTVSQTLFRELPRQKDTEHQWEPHESRLQLPVRDVVEFRGQLTVPRGRWTVASLVPRDAGRACVVLVRVGWEPPVAQPATVDPLSGHGFVLDVIPVSMPTDANTERPVETWRVDNGMEMSASSEGFKKRAHRSQDEQQEQTYNFGFDDSYLGPSGISQVARPPSPKPSKSSSVRYDDGETSSAAPAESGMPDRIESLRMEVTQAEWPEGSALEFVANHVFVVHSPEVAGKVRRLLEWTHEWRNQPIPVEVSFPLLSPDSALLSGGAERCGAAAETTGRPWLPSGLMMSRTGAWNEMFAGEIQGVLAEAWAPDRSSPTLVAYWRGSRIEAQPQVAHDGARRVQVRWYHHRLERTAPEVKSAAVFQSPVSGTWSVDQTVELRRRCAVLVGAHAIESRRELQALQLKLGVARY